MKYWIYMNGEIPGSYEPEELVALPGFQETAMVCPAAGGVEDRSWRRAGQFPDIIEASEHQRASRPPAIFDPRPEPGPAQGPDDMLNDASSKIFGHVTDLMKELENRREERALCQSLQRQLIEAKNELQALRERGQYLQERVDLLPGFQKRENKLEEKIHQLEADAREHEDAFSQLDAKAKELASELNKTKKSERDLSTDLVRQSRLSDELNAKLAEKELQLARAFGIISKLESMLGDILPGATAGMQQRPAAERGDDVEPTEQAAPMPAQEAIIEEVQPAESAQEAPAPEPPLPAAVPQQESNGGFTTDAEMSDLKPDWPEEGEVKTVPPPWKERLKRVAGSIKERISKMSKHTDSAPPPPPAPSAETPAAEPETPSDTTGQ
ncbi:MAG: hypothetical protein ABIJ96_08760 [Elusimicrobiota bacterium]